MPSRDVPPIMHRAFDHFNQRLFGGRLKRPRMILADLEPGIAARAADSFSPMKFNRSSFEGGTDRDFAIMVHEMGHDAVGNHHGHDNTWRNEMDRHGFDATCDGYAYPRKGGAFDAALREFRGGCVAPAAESGTVGGLFSMPDTIREIGSHIASGGAGRNAAYDRLAGIAKHYGADPGDVDAALALAKRGGGSSGGPSTSRPPRQDNRPVGATLYDSANGVRMMPTSAPVSSGGDTVVIVDASASMRDANGDYDKRRRAMDTIIAAHPGCRIIAFRERPEFVTSLDDIPAVEGRQCADNDLPAAMRKARTINPRNVIVVSDAGKGIFDRTDGAAQREADRLHRECGANVSAVWMPQASAIIAAEENQSWRLCEGHDRPGRDMDPRKYISEARRHMESLVRGGGTFHSAEPRGSIFLGQNGDDVVADEFGSRIPPADYGNTMPPAPRPPEPPLNPGGGAYFDGDERMTIIPPEGGNMYGSRGRDYTVGAIDQMEDGANSMVLFRESQARRMARDAEESQVMIQTATAAMLDSVHTEMERGALQAENVELRHTQQILGHTITRLDALRRTLRADSDAAVSERIQECGAIERRYAGILDDLGGAVRAVMHAPTPQAAVIRGQYTPPQRIEHRPDVASAWVQTQVSMPARGRQAAISSYRPNFGAEARELIARDHAQRSEGGQNQPRQIAAVAPAAGQGIMALFQDRRRHAK